MADAGMESGLLLIGRKVEQNKKHKTKKFFNLSFIVKLFVWLMNVIIF